MAKKRKVSNLKIYSLVISIILLVLTILNMFLIFKINVFPLKYLILFLLLFALSAILIFFNIISNLKYSQKKKKKKLKINLCVLSTIFSVFFLLMFIYLNKTSGFLDNIISKGYKTENYIVVVKKDSNFNKIEELSDKKISYVTTDIYNIDKASGKLKEKIDFEVIKEDDYEKMLSALYDNKVDAILIEESYKDLLVSEASSNESNSLYKNFEEKTKIIYSFELKIKNENEEMQTDVNVSEEPFNIYISGIDTYGKISSVSRSDVNIVATVNPKTKQVLLTTIPRDYYVNLSGKTGYKDKLTHAGIYGIETSEKTIEDLLDIEINYYVKVNFTSLIKIVDAVGGINVYSEYSFSGEKYTFTKGYNTMNGQQALEFSRTRKTLASGDRARGKNQEAVIAALINKICSKAIITNYVSILDSLSDTFVTNMDQSKITELIKMQLNDMAKWNVTSIALDGTNGFDYTYSYKNQKLYVMIPTESTITSAKEKIKEVIDGKTLQSSYTESNGTSNTVSEKNNSNVSGNTNTNTNTNINTNTNNLNTNTLSQNIDSNSNGTNEKENEITSDIIDNNQEEIVNAETSENLEDTSSCTLIDGVCAEEYEEVVDLGV